ncbi:N-acetyltransferase [Paenibacillus sp. H1-7]|uniref:GNAT family N-acetyltransferase n=1 Tax=Paenibacillus sp. H1-7 TaxID=2282849 RepID=UPI001EF9439F|nr:GNAT family N-acetyltransferase [Paenibacillus sp. H1-7]ULL16187.1 N-acetyltransferase [Paenibacillus sp. H1-7]
MLAAKEHLVVTEQQVKEDAVYVIEDRGVIRGFYYFRSIGCEAELKWLFVSPEWIGLGLGKLLWEHLLETVKKAGISRFRIVSDPNAEAFYRKLGAKRIGWEPSSADSNLRLPLLEFTLDNSDAS